MLIALNLTNNEQNEQQFASEFVNDINNAIENCAAINETTSMNVENVSLCDDAQTFIAAMSQSQRDMITAQIQCFVETCDDDDDLIATIFKLFA